MAQTAIYNFQKPSGDKNVDEEFYQLQETLDLLDSILAALQTAVDAKSAVGHTHAIAAVLDLAAQLAAKMPASTTFKLDDLTDVSGAAGAPDNYVLVKSALGWIPSSALAALGTHGHLISEITGLVAALADKADVAATYTKTEVDTALGLKAPLANPALTGTPTVPTASPGTSTTQAASTAFVSAAVTAAPGRVIQTQSQFIGSVATGTTSIPNDDTIPQITEGDEYLTVTITPTNAASILEIDAQVVGSLNSGAQPAVALFRVGTSDALCATYLPAQGTGVPGIGTLKWRVAAGSTSAITFKVRAGPSSAGATYTLNGAAAARRFGGAMNSFLVVKEILP